MSTQGQCYSCGETGHIKRDCPKYQGDRQGERRDQSNVKCYNCGGFGHMSRQCNNQR